MNMFKTELRLPEIALLAGTRALLGVGIGLLLARKVSDRQRKVTGLTLLAIGVVTTIPLALMVADRRTPGSADDAVAETLS
jgi:hypothetical protein